MGALIAALINGIVVPEIRQIIVNHQQANGGATPTDEEIIAQLATRADTIAAKGNAFLDATK